MKILVVNGSPKGQYSITLQTVNYLQKLYPGHTFEVLEVGKRIKAIEKDFSAAAKLLQNAELILFSYPVYTFLAPSQLHRFIELIKQSDVDLRGKYASQITTSKHFYDVTAHAYIRENCLDMGLRFIEGLSADMDDLLTKAGQAQACAYFEHLIWAVQNGSFDEAMPIHPRHGGSRATLPPGRSAGKKVGNVVLLTDCAFEDLDLAAMISRFCSVLPMNVTVINLNEIRIDGGCLSCFHCATDGKCIYKDGFDEFLRNSIQTAQALVTAFTIRDHSMGARFKMYDDRQFCNGHRTVTAGMPVGYLVSGNLEDENNLRTVLEARAQVGGNYLAGIATDEYAETDERIDRMARELTYAVEQGYAPPKNFYGVGGMKIFRDLIYLMRGMMKADHRFFRSHGQYDFPQKKKGTTLKMYLVGALISNPKLRAKMGNKMNEGMIAPYKKLIDSTKP